MKHRVQYIFVFLPVIFWCAIACKKHASQESSVSGNKELPGILEARKWVKENKPDSAISVLQRELSHLKNDSLPADEFQILMEMTAIYQQWYLTERADSALFQAEGIYHQYLSHDTLIQAKLFQNSGKNELLKYNIDTAESLLLRAKNLLIPVTGTQDTLLCPIFNDLGSVQYYRGKYDSALVLFKHALELSKGKTVSNDRENARYNHNVGMMLKVLGRFNEASYYYYNSLHILQSVLDQNNPDFINLNRNLYFLNSSMGQYDRAQEHVNEMERVVIASYGKEHPRYAEVLELKAYLSFVQKKQQQSKLLYEEAYRILQKDIPQNERDLTYICSGLGNLAISEKNFDEGLKQLKLAIQYSEKKYPHETGNIIMSLAWIYELKKEFPLARKYYKQSEEILVRYYGKDFYLLGLLYRMMGQFEDLVGNYSLSEKYFEHSLEIYKKNFGKKSLYLADVWTVMGDLHLSTRGPLPALQSYQKAMVAMVPTFEDSCIYSNPSKSELIPDDYLNEILRKKAKAFEEMANRCYDTTLAHSYLHSAIQNLELTIYSLEHQRANNFLESSQIDFSKKINAYYRRVVQLSLKLYQSTGKKYYAELTHHYTDRRKLSVLNARINDATLKRAMGIPANFIEEENRIRLQMNRTQDLISRALRNPVINPAQMSDWKSELAYLYMQSDSLANVYQNQYPVYHTLKYAGKTSSLKEIQSNLQKDEFLIEYNLDSLQLHIWLISNQTNTLVSKKLDSSFIHKIRNFRQMISIPGNPDLERQEITRFIELGSEIYSILIPEEIQNAKQKHFILIPDGELSLLPFETLPVRNDSTVTGFFNVPYLIKENSVSYNYSASLFVQSRMKKNRFGNKILAFAPGYNSTSPGNTKYDSLLTSLPLSMEECNRIVELTGGKSFTGAEATRPAFEKYGPRFPVLHLAMHTLLDEEDPFLSLLAFSAGDSGNQHLMPAYEIGSMQLNANLVVLSACNTGFGKLDRSEGLINLSRGFLYAGAKSLITTLWAVPDHSSAELIAGFYNHLSEGIPKDVALSHSKVEIFINQDPVKAHPYYWAGYICIGDTVPLRTSRYVMSLVYGLIALPFVLLSFWIIRRRSKNDQGFN